MREFISIGVLGFRPNIKKGVYLVEACFCDQTENANLRSSIPNSLVSLTSLARQTFRVQLVLSSKAFI